MSLESLLAANGAPATKQFKKIPITTATFWSGLWTQRSPFGSPDSRYYTRFLGGRTDILIDGSNVELTNYSTIIRRPGTVPYSSASVGSAPLTFYSFHPINGSIQVMVDTATAFGTLTPTTFTSLFTKSASAGQSYFQGVGNDLYVGNGVDQKKWLFANNWAANTSYVTGNYIIDSNGNIQQITTPGTSGGSQPAWNAAVRGTTADNGMVWTNRGPQVANWGVAAPGAITVTPPTSPDIYHVRFWAPTHTYGGGASNIYSIFDEASLSMFLLVNGAQPTGSTYPAFNSIFGSTTTDGSTSWVCIGNQLPALQFYKGNNQVFINYGTLIDPNGNIQCVTTNGGTTSASTNLPAFSSTPGGTVVDGTITWTCLGAAKIISPSYIWGAAFHTVDGQYSPLSVLTSTIAPMGQGPFTATVTGTGTAEGQVDTIAVFRNLAGGSTEFFDGTTANPGASGWTFTDSTLDSALNILLPGDVINANAPPPSGLIRMTYHLNRVWGAVGNNVYFSALIGDETLIGVGPQCWPASNVFVFPEPVTRLMPIASGLLVFTTDDIWIITGTSRTGTAGPLLSSQLFQQGVGLLSYNALDVEGNQVFLYTSDKQFIAFTASGPNEIGYPIGVDLQNTFDPTKVYVAALVAGTQDKAVFIDDGTSSWFRCNWNQPPEGGPAWSPRATITGGTSSVVSVETSAGVHQLLIGQSNGTVLARSYSTFSDNGTSYSAFATIGSLVLAKPGQLALLDSIVLELQKVGSIPSVLLMLDEISNDFETLPNPVDDPPRLLPSNSVYSKRWYVAGGNNPAPCRHIQLKISFASEAAKNELLTVTTIGSLVSDE